MGGEEERQLEHHMGRRHSREGTDELSADVREDVEPGDAPQPGIRECHGRIEVSARDGPEGQDERDEASSRGEGVGE
jgi:hypothetical protein